MEEILKDIKNKKLKYSDILHLCKTNKLEETYQDLYFEPNTKNYFIYQIGSNKFIMLFKEEVNLKIKDSFGKYYKKNIM